MCWVVSGFSSGNLQSVLGLPLACSSGLFTWKSSLFYRVLPCLQTNLAWLLKNFYYAFTEFSIYIFSLVQNFPNALTEKLPMCFRPPPSKLCWFIHLPKNSIQQDVKPEILASCLNQKQQMHPGYSTFTKPADLFGI